MKLHLPFAVTMALASALSLGQQSASLYGQGRNAAFAANAYAQAFRQVKDLKTDEERLSDAFSNPLPGQTWPEKAAILPLGGKYEATVQLDAGETLCAVVISDSFDPTLTALDPDQVQAATISREESDQTPVLTFVAAKKGAYKLRVSTNQPGEGGKFTLRYHRFRAVDVGLKPATYPVPLQRVPGEPLVIRVQLEAGKAYEIRGPFLHVQEGASPYAYRLGQPNAILGPTGVANKDFTLLDDGRTVLIADQSGSFYFNYGQVKGQAVETDLRTINVVKVAKNEKAKVDIPADSVTIIQTDVAKGDIVRTLLGPDSHAEFLSFTPDDDGTVSSEPAHQEAVFDCPAYTGYRLRAYSDVDTIRSIHQSGTIKLVLAGQSYDTTQDFENTTDIPVWSPGKPVGDSIRIGDSKVYLFKSSVSELSRVSAEADYFQPKLEIFNQDGTIANTLTDRYQKSTGDDLYFPSEAIFLVRISCDGDGGSGSYKLTRTTLEPTAYVLGSVVTTNLDSQTYGLYTVNLEKGKTYDLLTSDTVRPDLLDPTGQFITSQPISFNTVEVNYFHVETSGPHRLWLRGDAKGLKFVLKEHIDPMIGA